MEMHVELRCDITVQDGVDVLQVIPTCVLVHWVGLQVRSVKATAATSSCLNLSGLGENW